MSLEGHTNDVARQEEADCGQNKNFKMYMVVESGMLDEVVYKFFEPGHSMMDSDRDFGLIEKRKLAHTPQLGRSH